MLTYPLSLWDYLLSLFARQRGSRGGQRSMREGKLQRGGISPQQSLDFCRHCGNPEINSESHCDECGWSPTDW